jgi:rfaE bifunctional protein kinase chain/domain
VNKEKENLLSIVDRFAQKKIAVWGDFILDEYLYGHTRRISREAPVLILSYESREFALGGAGNSILNIKSLGATPIPVGVIGADRAGQRILQLLKKQAVSAEGLIKDKTYKTPMKTRILAGEVSTRKQQILRIDQEVKVPDTTDIRKKLQARLEPLVKRADALLISDYNYFTVKESVFTSILPDFRRAKIPVSLDSRFRLLRFKRVSVATPNEPEVEEALNVKLDDNIRTVKQAGRYLLKTLKAKAVLITRGSKGMALFEKERLPFLIPIHGSSDIVDVTGAGDTVISVFTLALACGATFKEAALIANHAGGIVVMKKSTAVVTPEELKESIIS